MKRVAIVGATGYIGSEISKRLPRCKVFLINRRNVQYKTLSGQNPSMQDHFEKNLLSINPSFIINAAGLTQGSTAELFESNVLLPVNIAKFILKAMPETVFIHMGSAAEYGPGNSAQRLSEESFCAPVSDYGRSKLLCFESLLDLKLRSGLKLVYLRLFNMVSVHNSPRQVIGSFITRVNAANDPKNVTMGDLSSVRDFMLIKDLCVLIERIISDNVSSETINVCSGNARVTRDIIRWLINIHPADVFLKESKSRSTDRIDVVVGDPTKFFKFSGLKSATPIEVDLRKVWD